MVQRDIPKVIEAMVSFLTAVEEYQLEVNAMSPPISPETSGKELAEHLALAREVERASEVLGVVSGGTFSLFFFSLLPSLSSLEYHTDSSGAGLKEALDRIVWTFGDKLMAFKFPPKVASKLQTFVDYNANT